MPTKAPWAWPLCPGVHIHRLGDPPLALPAENLLPWSCTYHFKSGVLEFHELLPVANYRWRGQLRQLLSVLVGAARVLAVAEMYHYEIL